MRNRYLPPDALKVEPEATPADAPATVDRSAKLAARMQHRALGGKGGMTSEERAIHARELRRKQRERGDELLARISDSLRNTDPVLDEREPTPEEIRGEQHDKAAIKKILRDRRVYGRIQAASARRNGRWVEAEPTNDGDDKSVSR